MAVHIYRELSDPTPSLYTWLEERDQLFVVQDPKGIEHIYIDNGTPRDAVITEEIVGIEGIFPGCTKSFALFSEDGDFIAEYARIDAAERAAAKVKTVVVNTVDEDDPAKGLSWNSIDGDGTEELDNDQVPIDHVDRRSFADAVLANG